MLVVITGAILVLDTYVHHSFHLGRKNLLNQVELDSVRNSDVQVGEELVPVEREI